jgi:hypothetical protein
LGDFITAQCSYSEYVRFMVLGRVSLQSLGVTIEVRGDEAELNGVLRWPLVGHGPPGSPQLRRRSPLGVEMCVISVMDWITRQLPHLHCRSRAHLTTHTPPPLPTHRIASPKFAPIESCWHVLQSHADPRLMLFRDTRDGCMPTRRRRACHYPFI